MAESKNSEVVCRERERFARDLHDDVIQSIYAVGLELQAAGLIFDKDHESAAGKVRSSIQRLNEVIHSIRAYIQRLESADRERDLETLLKNIVQQFREQAGKEIEFVLHYDSTPLLERLINKEEWQQEIRQILREAL